MQCLEFSPQQIDLIAFFSFATFCIIDVPMLLMKHDEMIFFRSDVFCKQFKFVLMAECFDCKQLKRKIHFDDIATLD